MEKAGGKERLPFNTEGGDGERADTHSQNRK